MLNCSMCSNETNNGLSILKDIFICKDCVYKILTLYVYLNPIKALCPFCYDKKKKRDKCNYCDISKRMEAFKYENL